MQMVCRMYKTPEKGFFTRKRAQEEREYACMCAHGKKKLLHEGEKSDTHKKVSGSLRVCFLLYGFAYIIIEGSKKRSRILHCLDRITKLSHIDDGLHTR